MEPKIGAVSSLGYLMYLHMKDPTRVQELLAQLGPLLKEAIEIAIPLQKETILDFREFHGRRTFFVIIRDGIEPSARGVAPHQPGIEGLQKF